MEENRALVIAGMHRSGTSLVASMAQRAGVMIGETLLAANEGNPRGYFEDRDFYYFHQEQLRRSGHGLLAATPPALPDPDQVEKAKALIAERRAHQLWGFKDPRASLFLPFWHRLLPRARYLLVYRHPVDVVLSLIRRGTEAEVIADPLLGLRSWNVYNRCLLDFHRRHPGVCLLCDVDRIVDDVDGFLAALRQLVGEPLAAEGVRELVAPEELRRFRGAAEAALLLGRIAPETSRIYGELTAAADLPAGEARDSDGAPLAAGPEGGFAAAAAALQEVAERSMADEALADVVPGPLFALLLALADPALAAARRSRRALSGLRSETENYRLSREAERLAAKVETLETDADERARRYRRLEERLGSAEDRLRELQSELDERTRWACNIDIWAEERKARICELQAELDREVARRRRLQVELARRDSRICELEAELTRQGAPPPEPGPGASPEAEPAAAGRSVNDRGTGPAATGSAG